MRSTKLANWLARVDMVRDTLAESISATSRCHLTKCSILVVG